MTQEAPAGTTSLDTSTWQVPAYDRHELAPRARDYCVVIPVINEGARIRHLLQSMHELRVPEIADIIIVDAGSTDGSLDHDFLRQVGVRTLLVKTGPGKLSSQLRCAYAYALIEGYAGVVTIDGNDKDDPAAIPAFIAALDQGVDFAQASRFVPGGVAENTPLARWVAIRCLHAPLLSFASGFHWTDTTQGFRAYSRRLLVHPEMQPFRDLFETYELLAYISYRAPRLGLTCRELPTARRYPKDEKPPTKIKGLRANWSLIRILVAACRGQYNPRVK